VNSTTRRAGAVATAVAIVAALVLHAAPAQAYDTFGGHRLRNGVGNYGANDQYYFVDASANPQRTTAIAAMDDWIYTTTRVGVTTPISFIRTTNRPSSIIDVFRVSYVSPTWWGRTQMYNGSTLQNPENGNWYWALVQLTNDYADCPNQRGVIAHEMGHSMGLAHVGTASSLMYTDIAYTSVRAAVRDDLNGINFLY
jgi:hypothetical protein